MCGRLNAARARDAHRRWFVTQQVRPLRRRWAGPLSSMQPAAPHCPKAWRTLGACAATCPAPCAAHLPRRLLLKQLSHARQLLGGSEVAVARAAAARALHRPPLRIGHLPGEGPNGISEPGCCSWIPGSATPATPAAWAHAGVQGLRGRPPGLAGCRARQRRPAARRRLERGAQACVRGPSPA